MPGGVELCAVIGCMEWARWRPVIKIWAKGYPKETHAPLKMIITLLHCDAHRKTVKASTFVGEEEQRRQITDTLKADGVRPPDFDSAEIEWEPARSSGDPGLN